MLLLKNGAKIENNNNIIYKLVFIFMLKLLSEPKILTNRGQKIK